MSPVVPGDDARLWWSLSTYRGDDRILSWASGEGVQRHQVNLGPRPDPNATQALNVGGVIGDGDVILGGQWEQEVSSLIPPRFQRSSGLPADWQLDGLITVSEHGQLVAGLAREKGSHCLAVYAVNAATPNWTRCFERRGRPAEIVSAQFTSDGSRIAVLVRGGRFDGPAAIFHVGRDTLLVLDSTRGRISTRIDHNFDRVVLEDDRHVVFVRHVPPHVGGTDEGPYSAWLMRCGFDGSCERASPPLHADTKSGAVSVVPLG